MHALNQLRKKDWPPLIQEFAEIIGDDAALVMFITFGGRHLRVPMTCPPDHKISVAIGADKAALFAKRFGREMLMIPNGKKQLIAVNNGIRNREIMADWHRGFKQCDLATKYQLSERRINQIIKNELSKPRQ